VLLSATIGLDRLRSTGHGLPRPPPDDFRPRPVYVIASEDDFDREMFTPADHAALTGDWSWIGTMVNPALEQGTGGLIDDALAAVRPWGFDPAAISTPVLLVHGTADRVMPSAHSEWLARRVGGRAELVLVKDAGHISVFSAASEALAWLAKLG